MRQTPALVEYQRIRRWKLWPQLDFPRTAIGKIQRRKITEWVAAHSAERTALVSEPDPLSNLIARITGADPGDLADEGRLDPQLNLDSLARVQLQSELEQRLGVSISDEEFERIQTFGQLRARLGFETSASATAGPCVGPHPALSPSREPRNEAAQLPVQSATAESSHLIYPHWTWWPAMQALRVLFQETVMRPLVWLLAAPSVSALRSKPPERPVLLIANHVTI